MDLNELATQTAAFGTKLDATALLASQALETHKKVESDLNAMQAAFTAANDETKATIKAAMDAKLAEFMPKMEELQKVVEAQAAAAERIAAAGNNPGKKDDTDPKASTKDFLEFVLASRSGDDGKFNTPEITDAMVEAHTKYERLLAGALFSADRHNMINVASAINRDPVAAGVFSAGFANLSPAEADAINRSAASLSMDFNKSYKAGMSVEAMQRAGMFSPSIQAPEYQMPAIFSEMLRCFEDPTDIAGMVTRRNISKRRYRQWREVVDTGLGTWECENQCQPAGADPLVLPTPQDGQVYGVSSHVCIHVDDLEDRDQDWGAFITRTLADRLKRTVGKGIMFGTGKGQPQSLVKNITQFNLATSPSPLPTGAFIDWVNVEIGASMLKTGLRNIGLYGNRAGYTHLATTRNALSDRSNVIRFGADGRLFIGSYEYRNLNYLPEGSDINATVTPLQAQKVNFILGDLKEAYTLVVRKEAGISRHEPTNGGTCAAFLVRARVDGYVGCANAAVAFTSP